MLSFMLSLAWRLRYIGPAVRSQVALLVCPFLCLHEDDSLDRYAVASLNDPPSIRKTADVVTQH